MGGMHGHGGGHGVEAIAGRDSPIHRLDPRVKIIGLIGLVIISVSTPAGAWAAFAAYAAVLVALCALARLPLGYVLRRMTVEIPFLIAAALLPFTVPDGLERGGTVAAKATIGVLAAVLLSSTTPFPTLVRGFEALRAPRTITMLVSFMWRYLYVLGDEARRMRIARDARCYKGRWLWQAGAVGAMIATLFIRALERGERVYLAMISRGYTGALPALGGDQLVLRTTDLGFLTALAGIALSARAVRP
jgi:cobalt/nickel transport system permease protein